MKNVKWYSSSQVSTAKHVSYPQLTATEVNSNYVQRNNILRFSRKLFGDDFKHQSGYVASAMSSAMTSDMNSEMISDVVSEVISEFATTRCGLEIFVCL